MITPSGVAHGQVRRLSAGDDPLGGSPVPTETLAILQRRRGGGQSLPDNVAGPMGDHLGIDLSSVRVHADAESHDVSRSLQATAFTHGTDIYFGRGAYNPGSTAGQEVLAHELAHVAQQGTGSTGSGPIIGRADDPAEVAADKVAHDVMHRLKSPTTPDAAAGGGPMSLRRMTTADDPLGALRRQAAWVEKRATHPSGDVVRRWPDLVKMFQDWWNTPSTTDSPSPTAGSGGAILGTPVVNTGTPVVTPEVISGTPVVTPEVISGTPVVTPEVSTGTPVVTTPVVTPTVTTEAVTTTPTATPTVTLDASTGTPVVGTPVVTTPTVVVPKPAKTVFEEALTPLAAPANVGEGNTRMAGLRLLLGTMSTSDRKSIADDKAVMAKGLIFVGKIGYMSLLAAVDMNKKRKTSTGAEVKHHLSGAEADSFIATNIPDYPHLQPYFAAATLAGKKGEGFVASVDPDDWNAIYETQFPTEPIGSDDELETNAYTANKNPDRPAILHQDRGTPSTAIHESMHQYSNPSGVRDTYGAGLNEGVTEYFTRVLTDQNAEPAKNNGPERDNYQSEVTFVRSMIRILGPNKVAQETILADIYFKGEMGKFKEKFTAAWLAKEPTLGGPALELKWTAFDAKVKAKAWSAALALMPAP